MAEAGYARSPCGTNPCAATNTTRAIPQGIANADNIF
eukprot:COSAG05_NODE_13364_length_433_cov_0.850299_1_plen_36_part_01